MAESSQVQDLLECPICQERFTEPKVLSCQHTFCLSCLRGYVKDARHFNCPSCRRRHNVPRNGVDALKDNFFIRNLMDIVEGRPTAECPDCCLEDQVLGECDHCKERVCAPCRAKHIEVSVEIMVQFLSMVDKIHSETERPGNHGDGSSLVFFNSEDEQELKRSLHAQFDKAACASKERRDILLAQVEDVTDFRRLLSMEREDARSSVQGKMKACRSVHKLTSLKNSFMRLESEGALILRGNSVLKLDVTSLRNLGQIYFDDCALESPSNNELEGNGKLDQGCQTLADSCNGLVSSQNVTSLRLPTNVDYQSKRFVVSRRITEHPDVGSEFTPSSAVHCGRKDAIYCISGGKLLCYNMQTLVGTRVCDAENAKHVAVMDSGKVLFTDGKSVKCVMDTDLESNNSLVVHLLSGFNNATQVCCLGNDFLVLDVGTRSRVLIFTEEGKLVREISAKYHNYWSSGGSKMCVDGEGRIYVSDIRITRKDNDHDWLLYCGYDSCQRNKYMASKSVKVSFEVAISILTWDGEESGQLVVDRGSEDYEYEFNWNRSKSCPSGLQHYVRDDESAPSDDQIIREKAIRGLCVDGDGYISVTEPDQNQVNVCDHAERVAMQSPLEPPLSEPEVQTASPSPLLNYRRWFIPCIILAVALAPIPCLYTLAELCQRSRIAEDLRNFLSSDEEKIKENIPKISLALLASFLFAMLLLLQFAERWIKLVRWLKNSVDSSTYCQKRSSKSAGYRVRERH